jgi:predicted alpha-1,2-mannosidase
VRDFDIATAYEAFLKSADTPGAQNLMRPDNDPYVALGYVPLNYFSADFSGDNSVSHALEYYVADYALSRLATELGRADDAARFYQLSLGYKNYWSPADKCLRPRYKDGTFLTPFNPEDGADFSNAPGFHEGSAWNYTFAVPHDVLGYAKLQGGTKAFVNNLQHVFDQGLYDPANEPDIVYPYLFSRFKGYEKRTWAAVEKILSENYKNAPDGIPGNDDTGTMSAWAVFSMLGIYPDCPGEPTFTLTRPTFPKAVVTLPDGHEVTLTRSSAQASKVRIDGKAQGFRVSHDALLQTRAIAWR